MSWKEILKPDWRKIVISIILTILGISYMFIPVMYYKISIFIKIFYLPILLLYGLGWNHLNLSILLRNILSSQLIHLIYLLISFVFSFIVWYLLSCIMVWIYNKVKKK